MSTKLPFLIPNYKDTATLKWSESASYPDPDGSGNFVADLTGDITTVGEIGITVDGGGSAVTTGSKGFFQLQYAGTILSVTLIADQVGSVLFDILKSDLAHVGAGASIVASDPPALASVQTSTDAALTGWTTSLAAGDVLEYKISSASTITRVTLILKVQRT